MCVLLTLQIICSLVRVSSAALLRWKERDTAVDTASEEPPRHRALPCPPGAHVSWEHKDGEGEVALLLTKRKSKGGKQEHSGELTAVEAELGVRRGKHSKASARESQQGEAACPAQMWGRAQTSCSGKQQNRATVAVEGGRKGNSQLRARGGEGCQL